MKLEELQKQLNELKEENKNFHKARHIDLHKSLDELMADYMKCTGKMITETRLEDLMKWSHEQTTNPTNKEDQEWN